MMVAPDLGLSALASPDAPPWNVYAIRYATLKSRRREVFLDGAPTDDGPQDLDYYIWVLKCEGRTIVVDTGCRPEIAQRRGRTFLQMPHEALAHLDIDASEVTDVIVTHLHYDHAGNLPQYPKARFHLQEREMQFATGRLMCGGPIFTGALEQEDVLEMVRNLFAQRVNLIDGDAQLAPGVRVIRIGGHTPGIQAVQVWTARGWLVLISDGAHLYENMTSGRPFHIVADVAEMRRGWAMARQLVASPDHVIPGHDPIVATQYPAAREGVDGIVSLHCPPIFSAVA